MAQDVDTSSLRHSASVLFLNRVHSWRWVTSSTCVDDSYTWYWSQLSVAEQADGALVHGRSGQPSVRASVATAQSATPVSRNATVSEEQPSSRPECEAVDLETILKEHDACGVRSRFCWLPAGPFLCWYCVHRKLSKGFCLVGGLHCQP